MSGKTNLIQQVSKFVVLLSVVFSIADFVNCDSRIVGGYPAALADTKYQLSLRIKVNDAIRFGNGLICGASLISESIALTAAHCVYNSGGLLRSASELIVVGGTLNRFVRNNNTIVRSLTSIIPHAQYNPATFENDIALLFLNETVPENHPTVQPIELISAEVADGTNCTASGWGTTYYGGPPSSILLAVNVLRVNTFACNETYEGGIMCGMSCAGLTEGGKDACQGDSGGPLLCNNQLSGVVSNGFECALPGIPGIYTDILTYRSWIESNGTVYEECIIPEQIQTTTKGGNSVSVQTTTTTSTSSSSLVSSTVQILKIPYHVAIRLKTVFLCSGAIITERHILTSASCLVPHFNATTVDDYQIVLGSNDVINFSDGVVQNVSRFKVHQNYVTGNLDYDLAIITVTEKIVFVENSIAAINISNSVIPMNTTCTVTGWGNIYSGEYVSSILAYETTIYDNSHPKCAANNSEYQLSNFTMCTLSSQWQTVSSLHNICSGNLGAPLVCDGELVGAAVYEGGCTSQDLPVIYSNLRSHRAWINANSNSYRFRHSSILSLIILAVLNTLFCRKR